MKGKTLTLVLIILTAISIPTSIILTLRETHFASQAKIAHTTSDYLVQPILLVPKGKEANQNLISQIPRILEWTKYWYASRLDGRTFTTTPLSIHNSQHDSEWFWQCHKERCYPQVTYYNVNEDLKQAGFPVGSVNTTRRNLVVFFQEEVKDGYPFLGGADYEHDSYNITFIATNHLRYVPSQDPFTINPTTFSCYDNMVTCMAPSLRREMSIIIHEITHTFGLPHVLASFSEDTFETIISEISVFPHNSFSESPTNPEKQKLLSSPFLNQTLQTIPYPLSTLRKSRIALQEGINFLSLPLMGPGLGNASTLFRLIIPSCTHMWIIGESGNWESHSCTNLSFTPRIGQGIVVEMKNPGVNIAHGITTQKPPVILLKQGWNFVGPAWTNYTSLPQMAFASLQESLEEVREYIPSTKSWNTYSPKSKQNSLSLVSTGHAYWIKVTQDAYWYPGLLLPLEQMEIISPQVSGVSRYSLPPTVELQPRFPSKNLSE